MKLVKLLDLNKEARRTGIDCCRIATACQFSEADDGAAEWKRRVRTVW